MQASAKRDPIEAVIFDLDGVLVSTDEQHYQSWKRVADEEAIRFDRQINRGCLGASRMESLTVLLGNARRRYTDPEKEELADRKNRYYLDLIEGLGPRDTLPGARELLRELRQRGIRLAVASGSRNAPHVLRKIELAGLFDACVSRLDIERSKPDPEMFLRAAERLGVRPARCLVVEDAPVGVEAARGAGMRVLGVGAHTLSGADRTVASLAQIGADQVLAL